LALQTPCPPTRIGSLVLGGVIAVVFAWSTPAWAQDADNSASGNAGSNTSSTGTDGTTTTTGPDGQTTNDEAPATGQPTRPPPARGPVFKPAASAESAESAESEASEGEQGRFEIISPDLPPKGPAAGPDTAKIEINFVDVDLLDLLKRFADWKRMNFIITDKKELEGKSVSIISHHKVTIREAYEAFQSALAMHGLTIVETNGMGRIVKSGDASKSPIKVGKGAPGRTDIITTQLIQLENVSVSDVSKVIQGLVSPEAQLTAYQPTNTLIITELGINMCRMVKIIGFLDQSTGADKIYLY
jgi:general secretion pathway protein D